MHFYFVLGIAAALALSLVRGGRKYFYRLAISSTRVLDVMLGDQDEDEKLDLLQKETFRLIIRLLLFIGLLIAASAVAYLSLYIYVKLWGLEFADLAAWDSWQGILSISIGATLPFLWPFKKSKSAYSELAILLHQMVLNNYNLGSKLLKREQKKRDLSSRPDFLIVSGLARAGTTSFMNLLAEIPEFKSLHYGNMPFLLSPNTWARFYKPKSTATKERSHKDGIQIGLGSNEALEEYFWKAISHDSYIEESHLKEYAVGAEEAEAYLRYQALVRQSENDIYLAKNNNFLLRYASLRNQLSEFKMVVLFREPIAQAASLMEKHQQYMAMQADDSFVLEYMDWLGHHEFGLGHKPFAFEGKEPPKGDPSTLDYWLGIWLNYYQRALELKDDKIQFIAYEDFCLKPEFYLKRLAHDFSVSAEGLNPQGFNNNRKLPEAQNDALVKKARALYQALRAES